MMNETEKHMVQEDDFQLIVLDVDGTLVTTNTGKDFRSTADDWKLLQGRQEKIQALKERGVKIVLATNQGGVAFGYMQEADIHHELILLQDALGADKLYVCYQHPKASVAIYRADSDWRKPAPGMILAAIQDFDIEPSAVLMVGDRPEDEQAANEAGVAFQWAHEFFVDTTP